jgi:hypothetical protein
MTLKPDYKKLILALDELNNKNTITKCDTLKCSKECIDKRIKTIDEEYDLFHNNINNIKVSC